MDGLLRMAKRASVLTLILLFTIGQAAPSGCVINALIVDPPRYDFMLKRVSTATPPYQVDNATTINVPVYVYGNGDYKFKVGAESTTDCAQPVGYSASWIPSTTKLQADISALPDGTIELCVVGRKQLAAGLFAVQPFNKATVYKWVKDIAGPGPFAINPPALPSNDNTPEISWSAATDAVSYSIAISETPDCSAAVQSFNSVTATSITANTISDGAYYICVSAADALGNVTNATNNGIQGVIDTVPPGTFDILSPSGDVVGIEQLAEWTSSSGASSYHLILADDSDCSNVVNQWHGINGTEVMIDVPEAGSFFLCAEAFDDANNITTATPSPFQVVAEPQETIVRDHVSNPLCTSNNQALYHYNDSGESDGIVAASFIGRGGIINRVGGIFADADCSVFNNGSIENMDVHVAFYESPQVFFDDPYLRNQPENSLSKMVEVTRVIVPQSSTPSGTEKYYVEADVSAFGFQTTVGREHLVALWFSSGNAAAGQTWMAFSSCGASEEPSDYYTSQNNSPAIAPSALQDLDVTSPHAAYFVTERRE